MTMKKNLIWNVAALMYALCMLTACNGDNDDENAPREGLKLLEHHVDEYGFQEGIEDYSGPYINIICNVCEFYGNPAQSDIKMLIISEMYISEEEMVTSLYRYLVGLFIIPQ